MRISAPTLRPPPTLYRYMEPEFAALAVERGSIRLSTTAEAATLEDGLRDDLDGGVRLRWNGGCIEDATEKSAMRSLGIHISGTIKVQFAPGDITRRVEANILCMTDTMPNDYIRRVAPTKTAVVQINDAIEFGWTLTRCLAAHLGLPKLSLTGDRVTYDDREFSNPLEVKTASPFIKRTDFSGESEWRLYWPTPEPEPTIIECRELCQFLKLVEH